MKNIVRVMAVAVMVLVAGCVTSTVVPGNPVVPRAVVEARAKMLKALEKTNCMNQPGIDEFIRISDKQTVAYKEWAVTAQEVVDRYNSKDARLKKSIRMYYKGVDKQDKICGEHGEYKAWGNATVALYDGFRVAATNYLKVVVECKYDDSAYWDRVSELVNKSESECKLHCAPGECPKTEAEYYKSTGVTSAEFCVVLDGIQVLSERADEYGKGDANMCEMWVRRWEVVKKGYLEWIRGIESGVPVVAGVEKK